MSATQRLARKLERTLSQTSGGRQAPLFCFNRGEKTSFAEKSFSKKIFLMGRRQLPPRS
jgi:hypothetical protein